MLTEVQKTALLEIARRSIERHLSGEQWLPEAADLLAAASGVFVTIRRCGELRGCLGTLQMRGPLTLEIARCARDSASRDPRFPPLRADELHETLLEISVLGPLEPINPVEEAAILIGRHGLVVEHGLRRGLLLPQVAVEWGWTREQFLRQTCYKAGLALDAWQNGARVFRFDAIVFGE